MRTTVTLDPDVEALLKRAMEERRLSFKEALNEAIRAGLRGRAPAAASSIPTYDMGEPLVDITQAVRLAGELEDDDLVRRLAQGR